MGAWDYQLGAVDEVAYNTPVTPTRFFEYNDNPLAVTPVSSRTEGTPLRVATRVQRSDRFVPWRSHAEGTIDFDVMTKGMGFWLKHALGAVATTGTGPYTHTFTMGTADDLYTKSFTAQLNYPFRGGANQSFTYSGGKVTSWSLGNSVEDMLTLSLGTWFASFTKDTALATASYPSAMENYAWSHGAVTIGGTAVKVTSITVEGDNGYGTDATRRLGNLRVAPTAGAASVSWSIETDWESTAQWDRVHAESVSGTLAAITGTWTNGANSITVNIPAGRFDGIEYGSEPGQPMQTLTGMGLHNGTNSPVTVTYVSADTLP